MSLRLAAFDAFSAIDCLLATGVTNKDSLEEYHINLAVARNQLRRELGINRLDADTEKPLDAVGLLEALASSLFIKPETALLAGAIKRAIAQHHAGAELQAQAQAAE